VSLQLQLKAALEGNLEREVDAGRKRVAFAAAAAMGDVAQGLQSKWRQDFASSGLARGEVLAKTVRLRVYKNNGLNPAAVVYSTAPRIVAAFEAGAVVTVHGKKGALYPNPEVWGGRIRRPSGRGGSSVSTFDIAKRRFGDLQFIPSKGGGKLVGVFVAKVDRAGRAQGKFRRAGIRATKRGLVDRVVVFFVLHEPRLPRLLRGNVIRARADRDFPVAFQRAFERHLAAANTGRGQLTFQDRDP
jgi:hypothetical protein